MAPPDAITIPSGAAIIVPAALAPAIAILVPAPIPNSPPITAAPPNAKDVLSATCNARL